MPDPTDKQYSAELPPGGTDPDANRRRLLQGALATTPVLMTLISRPVLGQSTCTSPSGFVSANASTAGRGVTCSGHTPEYWRNPAHFSEWPAGFKADQPHATRFNDQFNPPLQGNPLLVDVLAFTGSPTNDVARYVSAALLNAAKGLTPVLSTTAVKHIWHEFATTGFYSPTAGAQWNANEIISYLLTTWPS